MSLPLSERFTTPRQNWSALWSSLGPISNDTPEGKELEAAHLPPAALAAADLVRVVTQPAALALNILAPSCELSVGAVALPVFSLRGELYELSCKLGSVYPAAPQDGLLLNHPAQCLLSIGDPSPPPHAAVIVEGVFDFLTWSLIRPDLPVIGLLDAPGCTRQLIARLYQLEFERAWPHSLTVAVRVRTPMLAATIRAGLYGLNVPPINCADQHKLFASWDIVEGDDPLTAAATLGVPVTSAINDNRATQPDQHAPSSTAGAATAEGVAAAVDDVARTIPENEEAREEEENIRRARCAARMDADQNASEPQLELSVGCGRPWFEEDGSIKKDERGREKSPLDLEKVKPWVGTPRELHALLNSHRHASTNKGFKHKVGHFIVGAVFVGTEEHPAGHRHGDSLQHATLVLFDIDNAPSLTRAELEARLGSLGVGFIFYSTWSNARAGSGKAGLCARIVFWLTRPLTAPSDLPQALRVQSIGQQLAAIVRHLSTCLEIDSTEAVDEVSKRPHQLMYTPRGHDAGRSSPDCWWCEFHDGPALNPDSLPGGVSLAELLPPSAPQLADTDNPPSTPTPSVLPASSTASTSTPLKTSPRTREGSTEALEALRARGLAYNETCAEDLKSYTSGRYERITQHVGPRCGSIAAGHGLTEAEGLKPLADIVDSWGRPDLSKALRSTFAHGYQDPRTLPDSAPPRAPSKSSKKKAPPDLDTSSAAPSPASDAQPDTTQQHTEAASTAPRRSPPFAKGNPTLGTFFALPKRFDLMRRKCPDPQARPHLACVECLEDIDALASIIPNGKLVLIGIDPSHDLYPHALKTFRAKGCDVRHI